MSNSEPNATPAQATPPEELERRIMDPNIPKNEQEHWAANEIHRLRDLLNGGCSMHPSVTPTGATPDQLPIDDQLIALVRVARALRYDEGAEWISRRAMAQVDKEIAEVSQPPLPIPSSMDAIEWTKCWLSYIAINPAIPSDEGTMIGWFANAIMAGFDEARRRYEKSHPPASEPSRTDAVREAIALVNRHPLCGDGPASACAAVPENPLECLRADLLRPVVAAIADAEQQAKDAEDDAELKGLELSVTHRDTETIVSWLEMERAANAALTRKLATAREAIEAIRKSTLEGGHPIAVIQIVRKFASNTLAAIDAPAGEKAVSPSDWCLAITCPSCGARCQLKNGHWFGVPHDGACAADCNAPPPEPANAQGSEAMTEDGLIAAIENADLLFSGCGCRGLNCGCSASREQLSHVIVVWLKERNDALERAAGRMSVAVRQLLNSQSLIFNIGTSAANYVTKAIGVEADELRSVLAQRAKGKQ